MVTTVSTGNGFINSAIVGYNRLTQSVEDSAARLAGGKRILRVGDDVSSFSIAARLQTQISTYRQAITDVATSDTLVEVAKTGLESVRDKLEVAASLADLANSNTLIAQDRAILQKQFEATLEEIDRIVNDTTFENQKLLDGSFSDKNIRVGPEQADFLNIAISDVGTDGLFASTPDLTTQANAATAETDIADALETVGNIIGALEGAQGQLFSASENISSTLSGVAQAESALSDTDIEAETQALAEAQIKLNIGSAVIAQASRISNDLLNVLDFKIEIDTKPELNALEDEEEVDSSDNESTQSTGTDANPTAEAA